MKVGAVIVAAGMSSRMGDFKPLLHVGSISISQRIVATLRQGGAEKIVVVTGYRADELEHHLSRSGIIFLRNENYRTTQMFDSARLGLEYLKDKCDRVLFTPVDIPLFTASTVEALLENGGELVCPECQGQSGHPILMSSCVIEKVLADTGEGGLKGALSRCGICQQTIAVSDPGILQDADTPQDYAALLDYHNRQLVRPDIQVALLRQHPFFDARIAMLLSLIDETHSVRLACKRMQISYSSGWNILNAIEAELGRCLVLRSQGGAKGGSSALTSEGQRLLDAYTRYCAALRKAGDELFGQFFPDHIT